MKSPNFVPRIAFAAGLCLCTAFAGPAAEAPKPLSFKLLGKTLHKENAATAFPAELRKLDGKRVRIAGFASPYDDPEKMDKILLTGTSVGCFFCNPPEENGVVFVRRSPHEKRPEMDSDSVTVEGTLHLVSPNSKDEEAKQFIFMIDDAKIIPRKG